MKYDNLLKTIFHDAMPALLRVLACGSIAEYVNVEFPGRPKMVADVVARLVDGRILHIEFQLTNDPRMHWRCFHYFGAIQEQWEGSEVVQVVIYLGNAPMQMKREIRTGSLRYRYEILDMRDLDAELSSILPTTPSASWRYSANLPTPGLRSAGYWHPGRASRASNCSKTSTACEPCPNCVNSRQ